MTESLVWLESHAATTDRLAAARRTAALTDAEMGELIAATIAAATSYAMAFPGTTIAQVLDEANRRLPAELQLQAPAREPSR